MTNLWNLNTPANFWMCQTPITKQHWQVAVERSYSSLSIGSIANIEDFLALTLGESQYGLNHWKLSLPKRLYYQLKPIIPRPITRMMRRYYKNPQNSQLKTNWPIDPRYALFQWQVMRQLLILTGKQSIDYINFWPEDYHYSFILTHDIETATGQAFVREIADLEERLGFRSSFNFVLERYPLDIQLMQELQERGFEIGCHGLKHDGKLYNTKQVFNNRAAKINKDMKAYGMVGFRSPLTHRNPEWLQQLNIEYDSSFFDTDPFEPIPGGTMSIWPFFLGHFVELPYTMVQDYTLTSILGETTPRIWLDKIEFINKYRGMALLNTHPDYLKDKSVLNIYINFLQSMANSSNYWHALPRDIAGWWRKRAISLQNSDLINRKYASAFLDGGKLCIEV